jgi:hypothetical protein
MLGFELDVEGQLINAAIGKRCISIIVEKKKDRFSVRFSGSDFTTNESMTWYESELSIGSKMTVAITDIINESVAAMITKIEPNSCSQEDNRGIVLEAEKRELAELRQLLMQRGVLLPLDF